MNKIILTLSVLILLASCNSKNKKTTIWQTKKTKRKSQLQKLTIRQK
ncbi:lipoprotein [Zobellia sp. OII3]